eukprot:11011121-Ditylum_brightwellii.AAC.2
MHTGRIVENYSGISTKNAPHLATHKTVQTAEAPDANDKGMEEVIVIETEKKKNDSDEPEKEEEMKKEGADTQNEITNKGEKKKEEASVKRITKAPGKTIWNKTTKVKAGKITRDQQIRLNVIYKTQLSKSEDSADYIKEGCAELIGKAIEAVSGGSKRNSNGEQ